MSANAMAHDKVNTALNPVCTDMFQTDTNRVANPATMPGLDMPDRDLAKARVAALKPDAS